MGQLVIAVHNVAGLLIFIYFLFFFWGDEICQMKSENSRLNNWSNSSLIGVGGSRSGFITTKGETNTNRKDSAAAKWLQVALEATRDEWRFTGLFVLVVLPQNEADWLRFLSAKTSVTMSRNSLLRLLINQLLMRTNEKMKKKKKTLSCLSFSDRNPR